jgi:hypothetical protein
MPKYGDFVSARVKPQWKSTTKPARDAEGWETGAKGIDGAWDKDSKDWVGTWNEKSDRALLGPLPPRHGTHPKEKPGS